MNAEPTIDLPPVHEWIDDAERAKRAQEYLGRVARGSMHRDARAGEHWGMRLLRRLGLWR